LDSCEILSICADIFEDDIAGENRCDNTVRYVSVIFFEIEGEGTDLPTAWND
jgi:hypothetical protein